MDAVLTLPEPPPAIAVDHASGRVSGAGAVARLGIAATRTAAAAMAPIGLFGFSRVARAIGKILPNPRQVVVTLAADARFAFPYADPYWSRLLSPRTPYERELEALLLAISGDAFAFIDCGANFGYWSVQMTSRRFGAHATIAVEAAPDTAEQARRNAALNGDRFPVLGRAVAARSGETVSFYGARHEARSLQPDGSAAMAEVSTLALDDLLARPELAHAERIVLKLDVEGAEQAALAGAAALRTRDLLVVYEDHGSDPTHAVSRDFQAAGLTIFRLDGDRVRRVAALAELTAVKRRRRWGYEFVATDSPHWLRRLDGLALRSR